VLTTHSPIVLKRVKPEEVDLAYRHLGKTQLRPLLAVAPDMERLYFEEGFDVFELYDSGLLAEALPAAFGEPQ
jgi:hypothetical protein